MPDMCKAGLWAVLDAAHTVLRMVDASDQTAAQTDETLDAVSVAVATIERAARDAEHVLPEFRSLSFGGGAQR